MQLVVRAPFGARINGLGPGHAEAVLPLVRLRTAGHGRRRRVHPLARPAAQLSDREPVPDAADATMSRTCWSRPCSRCRCSRSAGGGTSRGRCSCCGCRNGKKVPPALQRFRSDDLLTAVFPKLTGCQENIVGDHRTARPSAGRSRRCTTACTRRSTSTGCWRCCGASSGRDHVHRPRHARAVAVRYELLNANPYAFLDGGEVQERRRLRGADSADADVNDVRDLGRLNPEAIAQVVAESQPVVRNADELHDVLQSRYLLQLSFAPNPVCRATPVVAEAAKFGRRSWQLRQRELATLVRRPRRRRPPTEVAYLPGRRGWVATERWPAVKFLFPEAICRPAVTAHRRPAAGRCDRGRRRPAAWPAGNRRADHRRRDQLTHRPAGVASHRSARVARRRRQRASRALPRTTDRRSNRAPRLLGSS